MKLTDTAINTATATTKPYKMPDGGGMYVLIMPNGSKYFRLDYRLSGKRQTLALGVYPTLSLDNARLLRDTARRQIKDGIKPKINDGMEPSVSIDKPGSEVPKKMSFAEENNEQRKLTDEIGRKAAIEAFSKKRHDPVDANNKAKISANFQAATAGVLAAFGGPSAPAIDTDKNTVQDQSDTVKKLELDLLQQTQRNDELQSKLSTFLLFSKLTEEQKNMLFAPDSPALNKLKELSLLRVDNGINEFSDDALVKELERRGFEVSIYTQEKSA